MTTLEYIRQLEKEGLDDYEIEEALDEWERDKAERGRELIAELEEEQSHYWAFEDACEMRYRER